MSVEKPDFTGLMKQKIPYTILPNYVLQNVTDLDALGLWCHLISLPEDWNVNKQYLMNKFKMGKLKVTRLINTLRDLHLLEYIWHKNPDGTVKKVVLMVKNGEEFYEKILNKGGGSTIPVFQSLDDPVTGQSATTKENINTNKKEKLTNIYCPLEENLCKTPKESANQECSPEGERERNEEVNFSRNKKPKKGSHKYAPELVESFERFYEIYPRKEKGLIALDSWIKHKCYENEAAILADVQQRTRNNWAGRLKIHIPLPTTYINEKRWTDEIIPPELQRNSYAATNKIDRQLESLEALKRRRMERSGQVTIDLDRQDFQKA